LGLLIWLPIAMILHCHPHNTSFSLSHSQFKVCQPFSLYAHLYSQVTLYRYIVRIRLIHIYKGVQVSSVPAGGPKIRLDRRPQKQLKMLPIFSDWMLVKAVLGGMPESSRGSIPTAVAFDQCWMHYVGRGQLHFSSIDTPNAYLPPDIPIPEGQGILVFRAR
jgi:hypothetical protein